MISLSSITCLLVRFSGGIAFVSLSIIILSGISKVFPISYAEEYCIFDRLVLIYKGISAFHVFAFKV